MPLVPDDSIEFERLRQSDHWFVEAAIDAQIFKLVRTSVPLESVDAVDESFRMIDDVMNKFPIRGWGLVFDMRDARPAADPGIENAFRENRKRIYAPFARQAVLLRSAAGVMQVRRMLQKAPDPRIHITNDEAEALAWVAERPTADLR